MEKKKLGVVFGGMSTENEVSVVSAESILNNLDRERYEVFPIYIDKKGNWWKYIEDGQKREFGAEVENKEKIENLFEYLKGLDVIFPVLHGLYGEDGTIQGLFELLKIPYVGCKVLASSVGMDKVYTKIIFDKAGLIQTPYEYVRKYKDNYIYIDKNFNENILSLNEVAEKISFYIGDVRDIQSVKNAMHGVDYIFHAAALKQVPSCEFFPIEAVKTNVLGTENVLTAAIDEGVKSVICLSTDKAAYPVNAMGTSKAMMEKVIVAKSRTTKTTKICCTRYGNVMCSRGSVIPLWIDQIRNNNPITLTEPTMTRFIMSLEEAVDLVLFAFEHGEPGDILVQKAPACTIQTQAEAVCELFGGKKEDIKVIGIRHGEKMYETLLTNEECSHAIDMGNFYRVPCDKRGLNYDKYFTKGNTERAKLSEFNSNNTQLLTLKETKAKIASLTYIQEELAKDGLQK